MLVVLVEARTLEKVELFQSGVSYPDKVEDFSRKKNRRSYDADNLLLFRAGDGKAVFASFFKRRVEEGS
jgi:hypothetical protein